LRAFGLVVKAGGEFSLRSKLAATVAAVALVISAEQILARNPGLGGTEQQVTVMFVDIRSFTARAGNLKPHEGMGFLNCFLHAMVEVVEIEHDGMINKFLGDGFMALFGVDSAEHNHADKALAAGRPTTLGRDLGSTSIQTASEVVERISRRRRAQLF